MSIDWNDPDRDAVEPTPSEIWAAIEFYAGRGWKVFPLSPGKKLPIIPSPHERGHSCRGQCGQDGHGCYDGTSDLERLERWWRAYPKALIGLATGHQFDVLDVDFKVNEETGEIADAGARIDSFADEHGHDWGGMNDPERMMAVGTPSGGLHLYVAPVIGAGNRAPLDRALPGCDWRAFGGLVVGPPSWSPKRQLRYVWAPGHQHREPPPCPGWLARLARKDERHPVAVAERARVTVEQRGGDATPYAAAVLQGAANDIASATEGTRNTTLNGAAYRVGRFVAGGELAEGYATTCLVAAALACGLGQSYAEGVIAYAFGAAKEAPARTPSKVAAA